MTEHRAHHRHRPRQARPRRDAARRRHHGRRHAEQAKIAEDAGASAVMALERVPADIRRDGGVARMSDPAMIEGIQAAVTIPVMAKCRIGHFAEAQVLQSLGVDYIDESRGAHAGRRGVPRRQVGVHRAVRVRRDEPRRGAAAHRRGRGADPLEGRGRHRQHRRGGAPPALDPRRHPRAHRRRRRPSCYGWAKELRAPIDLVQEVAERGELPGPAVLRGRHRDAADAVARDAARRAGGVRRQRHLQVVRPGDAGQGDRRGDHALHATPPSSPRCRAASATRCAARRSTRSTSSSPSAAGERRAYARPPGDEGRASSRCRARSASTREALDALGARRRARSSGPSTSRGVDAIVLPGGESTTIDKLLDSSGPARAAARSLRDGLPALGDLRGPDRARREVRRRPPRPAAARRARRHRAPQRLRPPARLVRGALDVDGPRAAGRSPACSSARRVVERVGAGRRGAGRARRRAGARARRAVWVRDVPSRARRATSACTSCSS